MNVKSSFLQLTVVALFIGLSLARPDVISGQPINEVTITLTVYHLCQGDATIDPPQCRFEGKGAIVTDVNGSPIACGFGDHAYGCSPDGRDNNSTYPFTQNPITIPLEDYVKDVIFNELSFGSQAALQTQAIIVRTYALRQTNRGSISINNSARYQVYIPDSGTSLTNQAVTRTAGYYLTYNNSPALTEYSPDHIGSDMTTSGSQPYLSSVYDPIPPDNTIVPDPNSHGRGLAQLRAITWGYGFLEDNDYYPLWDLLRILAHYFTAIEFQNVPNVRNDYRFNVIRLDNL